MYYKKIYIEGANNVPKDVPLIFICNHPNSFMEACLLAVFQHRTLHFLVRGDMFEKKWLAPILRETNQIPIYRFKDGFEKLRNNKSSFSASFDILAENKCILLFPEGSTVFVPWLRPFQKGAARLATGTLDEKKIEDVFVMPCAVHYFNALETRSKVTLQFGEAISTRQFLNANPDSKDILSDYTEYLYKKMDEIVLNYPEDINREKIDNYLIDKYTNTFDVLNIGSTISKIPSRLKVELNNLKVNEAFTKTARATNRIVNKAWTLILLVLTFLLMIPAVIIYYPSLYIIKNWSRKLKSIEFQPPTRLAVSLVAHWLISMILLIVLIQFFSLKIAFLSLLLLQFSLFCCLLFKDAYQILFAKS
jgi:1-acyl-sn-glycerol-3-phosphate acyltransferase